VLEIEKPLWCNTDCELKCSSSKEDMDSISTLTLLPIKKRKLYSYSVDIIHENPLMEVTVLLHWLQKRKKKSQKI